ncbi:ribosome 60S biogenesis N-terminal-domain-containing protein [Lophiotrema nucula]|uniref:Ribosome 60S biogenesis N-terminal-domain-containing protein n=1 Tax=Lophiotrema nucula TaxID=690887 RepID=A0A6A5ZS96_9PLEO|nr:ribosome 60S biogenesis N-terminal-domain-containing protein [Lophiotrema nucula]
MGKRTASEADARHAQGVRHLKRQRIENPAERKPVNGAVSQEVTTGRQLQNALIFEQGAASNFRTGLNLLKDFLDSILYAADEHDLPGKRAILREYLESQRAKAREDKATQFLHDLIQAWEYAAETNFDALLTQIVANLALLFRVFSADPQCVEYGGLLCKAILQHSVLRRLHWSLSAMSPKETVISPILRLLTEMTKYNEGAHAKAIYLKNDFTLEPRALARNLGLWRGPKEDVAPDHRKPTVRTHTVRYLLTHLKFQDEAAKSEILSNYHVIRGIFDHLASDTPSLVLDVLDVFRDHVFADKAVQRRVKSRILVGKTLSSIASLYRYEVPEGQAEDDQRSPCVAAHKFLCLVCTSPAYGVMLPSSGYYPPAREEDDRNADLEDGTEQFVDLHFGEEAQSADGKTRNVILGEFIRSLKPYANTAQQELVLAIFKACPELVADYFAHKEAFHYDPKLTSTWIGYSSFLYQTIELPVPDHLAAKRSYRQQPPPFSALMQNILPQPLTQQALVRCLNHSSELVNFFAVRVLIVAFHKLRAILQELLSAVEARSSQLWKQTTRRILNDFCQRCPPIKAIIIASRKPTFQKDMMREAITRLWRLYYEITPQVALQEKFDVSIPLCNALAQAEMPASSPEDKAFRVMELEHWIQIARHSTAMRWWQRNKSLQYSPFTTLLRLMANSQDAELYSGVKALLVAISQEVDMLQTSTFPDALDALVASLSVPSGSSATSSHALEFVDDCCARFVRQPIKYFDDLDTLRAKDAAVASSLGPISPLLVTLIEQWPFKGGKAVKDNSAEPIAHWLSTFLFLLKLAGEDETLLSLVRQALVETSNPAHQSVLGDALMWKIGKQRAKEALKLATGADFSGSERSSISPVPQEEAEQPTNEFNTAELELPPEEDEKHSGLTRWRRKDIEESLEDGDIGALLLCLCSKYTEIRLQALANIRQLMAKINESESSDLLQLKLLLGEVLESAEPILHSRPLPYVGGVFAAHASTVLADPSHFMFGKVNEFLMKKPLWNVEHLPRYFGHEIINSKPEQDGSYHQEVDWYLDYLFDALRTSADMEIYRTRNVFEKLLSYYASGSCAISAKEKTVKLLLRAAAVGGSTTLITRCGVISWIQMRLESNDHRRQMLRLLASRVYETCDEEKVDAWSSGTAKERIALLAKVGT